MSIDAPHEKPVESGATSQNPGQQHEDSAPILRAEPQVPHAAIDAYHAEQAKSYRLERLKFGVEVLTVLAIVIYTCIAYRQWRSMREATEASKRSADAAASAADTTQKTLTSSNESATNTLTEMKAQSKAMQDTAIAANSQAETNKRALNQTIENSRLDHRAWVGLGGPIVPESFELTPHISMRTRIPTKNFGRSLALKVMADMEPVSHQEIHQRAPHVCDLILNIVNGTIPPNQLQGPQLKHGFTLFPNEEIFEPIETGDSTIKPESIDTLYFLGCIAYIDQFGQTHTTRFCVETPWLAKDFKLGQALISCSIYNEAN